MLPAPRREPGDMSANELERFGEINEQGQADVLRWTLGLPPTGADPVKRRRPGRRRDLVDLAHWAVDYEEALGRDGGRRVNHRLAAQRWPDEYEQDPELAAQRVRDRIKAAREEALLTSPARQGRPGGRATDRARLLIKATDRPPTTRSTSRSQPR